MKQELLLERGDHGRIKVFIGTVALIKCDEILLGQSEESFTMSFSEGKCVFVAQFPKDDWKLRMCSDELVCTEKLGANYSIYRACYP